MDVWIWKGIGECHLSLKRNYSFFLFFSLVTKIKKKWVKPVGGKTKREGHENYESIAGLGPCSVYNDPHTIL